MTLPYLVRRPQSQRHHRPPLLAMLHGRGSNEADLFALAQHFDPRFLVASVRAPFELAPNAFRWFDNLRAQGIDRVDVDELDRSVVAVAQTINDIVMAYGADPRQVYLLGFSQGAMIAYCVALTMPHRLRGAVAIAGRVLPEIATRAAPMAALQHLRLLIQHGRHDAVVPIERSYAARDLFADLHVMMGFREYDTDHCVSAQMLHDAVDFLSAQLNPVEEIGAH